MLADLGTQALLAFKSSREWKELCNELEEQRRLQLEAFVHAAATETQTKEEQMKEIQSRVQVIDEVLTLVDDALIDCQAELPLEDPNE